MQTKVFKYLPEIDAFILEEKYKKLAEHLGIVGWEQFAFIGRFFLMDNDFGEHWMDNWELREKINSSIKDTIDESEILIIDPWRFQDGKDGPAHSDSERIQFWKDVLNSFHISLDTLINEARKNKSEWENFGIEDADDGEYIADLEERIEALKKKGLG